MRALRSPRGRTSVALAILFLLTVYAERQRWFGRLLGSASGELAWMWSGTPPRLIEPRAFLAARDFELDSPPASALLEVLGDAEYVLLLNDRRIGSGRYRAGAPLDVYEVAPHLRAGRNRIVLELRSPIGSGGAALRLVDADGRVLVTADDGWQLHHGPMRALAADGPLPPSARLTVLGRSPLGRWGLPARGPTLPRFDQARAPEGALSARLYRQPGVADGWRRIVRERKPRLPARVEVDFGREVLAYLHLDIDPRGSREGLVRFGLEPQDSTGWHPDVFVVAVPGVNVWQDVEPRRFRYVEVVGLSGLKQVRAVALRESADALASRAEPATGLLGFTVEPPRLPLEDEIWRRFPRGSAEP